MARGATHVLGLDIGSQAIKAVELKLTGREIRMVGRPVVIPTPEHAVSGGRVVDSAELGQDIPGKVGLEALFDHGRAGDSLQVRAVVPALAIHDRESTMVRTHHCHRFRRARIPP